MNIGLDIAITLIFFLCGIFIFDANIDKEKIKKAYFNVFGENYDLDQNVFSINIANHLSVLESLYILKACKCGFIAKKETENYPVVGFSIKALEGIFIEREKKDSRLEAISDINLRQKEFLNKERLTSLTIYPEGSITNGKYVLPFRRGAFYALEPIRPFLFIDKSSTMLSPGMVPDHIQLIYYFSFLYNYFYVEHLPIMKPTEYMFKKYENHVNQSESKEKYEGFIQACYDIYLELGNLKATTKGLKESYEFYYLCRDYKENQTIKSDNIDECSKKK